MKRIITFHNTHPIFYRAAPSLIGVLILALIAIGTFTQISIQNRTPLIQSLSHTLFSGTGITAIIALCLITIMLLLLSGKATRLTFDIDKKTITAQQAFQKKHHFNFKREEFTGYTIRSQQWPNIVQLISQNGTATFLIRLYSKRKVAELQNILTTQLLLPETPNTHPLSKKNASSKKPSAYQREYDISIASFLETVQKDKQYFIRFMVITIILIAFAVILSILAPFLLTQNPSLQGIS